MVSSFGMCDSLGGVHDWDLEALSDFMESIYASPLRGLGEDKMCWISSKYKGSRVSDYYKILVGNTWFSLEKYLEAENSL